ncbi:MAG: DUF2802 domain-containing protein [Oceanicoccus sp.]
MSMVWFISIVSLIVAILALCGLIWAFSRLRSFEQLSAERVAALAAEISAVNGAAIGVGRRLIAVEKKLKLSIEQQQKIDGSNVDIQPYDQAATMAEQGADTQQLIDRCGLPEAEASLLSLLQSSVRQGAAN